MRLGGQREGTEASQKTWEAFHSACQIAIGPEGMETIQMAWKATLSSESQPKGLGGHPEGLKGRGRRNGERRTENGET